MPKSKQKKAPSASDYYFILDRDSSSFWIVEKTYWDEHQGANDRAFDGYLNPILPEGFSEAAESCFEYSGDLEAGRSELLKAGFTETTSNC